MVAQLSQPVGSAKNTKGTENMTKVTQKIIKITFIVQCMMNLNFIIRIIQLSFLLETTQNKVLLCAMQ